MFDAAISFEPAAHSYIRQGIRVQGKWPKEEG